MITSSDFDRMPESIRQQYAANKLVAETSPDKNSPEVVRAHQENEQFRKTLGIAYDNMNYSDFTKNVLYGGLKNQGNKYMKKLGSTYKSPYQRQMEIDAESVRNFNYNPEEDSLYKSYRDMYARQGLSAQDKTISNLTALSGGRNNSWASAAAAQVGQAYSQKAADMIPQLAEAAYNRLLQRYNISKDMENTNYSRYADQWNRDKTIADMYETRYNTALENARADERQAWDRVNNAIDSDYKRYSYDLEKQYGPTERAIQSQILMNQLKESNINLEYLPKSLQQQIRNGELTIEQLETELKYLAQTYEDAHAANVANLNKINAQISKVSGGSGYSGGGYSYSGSNNNYLDDYSIGDLLVDTGTGDLQHDRRRNDFMTARSLTRR